jgi:hypothetical protein
MITIKKDEKKVCIVCNSLFERKPGKSNSVWNNQRCCSASCSAISRRKEKTKREPRRADLVPGQGKHKGWRKSDE